jgi:hypothetical protein
MFPMNIRYSVVHANPLGDGRRKNSNSNSSSSSSHASVDAASNSPHHHTHAPVSPRVKYSPSAGGVSGNSSEFEPLPPFLPSHGGSRLNLSELNHDHAEQAVSVAEARHSFACGSNAVLADGLFFLPRVFRLEANIRAIQ